MNVKRVLATMCVATAVFGSTTVAATAQPSNYLKSYLVPNDFGFDGHSTPGVVTPSGDWTMFEDGYTDQSHFGTNGDKLAVWNDGDGLAQMGVFRPSTSTWYLADIFGDIQRIVRYGTAGDIPVQAHYRGIRKTTVLAVFRPSSGTWYIQGIGSYQYGTRGDIPVPGHYTNGDATDYADQVAVFRPSSGTWYLRGVGAYQYGTRGDVPAPADYNGDGNTDVAVYRPSTGTWYIRGIGTYQFGVRGDIPVTGDFNGDGRADIAVYRPSNQTLYVRGQGSLLLGVAGTPVGAAPYYD